jgi:hypothetical protein
MSNHEEIQRLLKASREMLQKNNTQLFEDISSIKKRYGIINEQTFKDSSPEIDTGEEVTQRVNVPGSVESEIDFDEDKKDNDNKDSKQQGYRISGGVLMIHGNDKKALELTTDDKRAFQETMDEFVSEVSEMADFNQLNLYSESAEWSGKIIDFDLDFIFRVGETNGVYINGNTVKVDQDFDSMLQKLRQYYEKFKSKWGKIIASRKKTD